MHRDKLLSQGYTKKWFDSQTVEAQLFNNHKRLIQIRKENKAFADLNNTKWITLEQYAIAAFTRYREDQHIICLLNYSGQSHHLAQTIVDVLGKGPHQLKDLWTDTLYEFTNPLGTFEIKPYQFLLLST